MAFAIIHMNDHFGQMVEYLRDEWHCAALSAVKTGQVTPSRNGMVAIRVGIAAILRAGAVSLLASRSAITRLYFSHAPDRSRVSTRFQNPHPLIRPRNWPRALIFLGAVWRTLRLNSASQSRGRECRSLRQDETAVCMPRLCSKKFPLTSPPTAKEFSCHGESLRQSEIVNKPLRYLRDWEGVSFLEQK